MTVPLSIAANFATPWLAAQFGHFNKRRAFIQANNTRAEFERISEFKQKPDTFTQYLIMVAIKTAFTIAVMGVFVDGSFAIAKISEGITTQEFVFLNQYSSFIYAAGMFVEMIGSLYIINICRAAFSAWAKVSNFDEYKKRFL